VQTQWRVFSGTVHRCGRGFFIDKIFLKLRSVKAQKMKKCSRLLLLFFFLYSAVFAQEYTIPRKIFVGDKAVLVLPLQGAGQNFNDITLTPLSPNFPSHEYVDFHIVILERRINASRLMIEFTAFVPGVIEFPAVEIGETRFSNLSVTVDSVIENNSSLTLSGPAPTLAMPGTALLFYGTITALIFLILFTIWFILKGRTFLIKYGDIFRRWKLFYSMKLMEKRFQKFILKGGDKRIILDKISDQFRIFLSSLTGSNCRSMTAREFKTLSFNENLEPSLLGNFFQSCDELRFSGSSVETQDILNLLADLRGFIRALEETRTLEETKTEERAA
jgi:hypothetical protein